MRPAIQKSRQELNSFREFPGTKSPIGSGETTERHLSSLGSSSGKVTPCTPQFSCCAVFSKLIDVAAIATQSVPLQQRRKRVPSTPVPLNHSAKRHKTLPKDTGSGMRLRDKSAINQPNAIPEPSGKRKSKMGPPRAPPIRRPLQTVCHDNVSSSVKT